MGTISFSGLLSCVSHVRVHSCHERVGRYLLILLLVAVRLVGFTSLVRCCKIGYTTKDPLRSSDISLTGIAVLMIMEA